MIRVNGMAYYKPSLASKLFHGVVDQRKEQHSWCFARTKNGVRATKRKTGRGRGRRPFLCSHPIFCTGKTMKILFLDPQPLRNTCCTGYYKPYKLIYSCLTISTCIEISLRSRLLYIDHFIHWIQHTAVHTLLHQFVHCRNIALWHWVFWYIIVDLFIFG